MIKSMTGYGKSSLSINSREYQVEIKTVNHKYIDVNIKMPRIISYLEEDVRKLVVIVEEEKPLYINHLRNISMNIICLQKTEEGYMMNIDDSFKKNKEDLLEEIKEELGLKEE